VYYIYTDHISTPRVVTDASNGNIVWNWAAADPFGLSAPNENPSGGGTSSYNLRLPGQLFDKETNNHYNYFRDYDPQLGRYLESDPIGLNGGMNTYMYVEGNPLSRIDPDGKIGVPAIIGIVVTGYSFYKIYTTINNAYKRDANAPSPADLV